MSKSRRIGWGLLSPIPALAVTLTIAALSILFPRSYYEHVIGEQSYIYHNPRAALYIALCAAAFLIGFAFHKYVLAAYFGRGRRQEQLPDRYLYSSLLLVIALCIVFIAVNTYSLVILFNTIPLTTIITSLLGSISSTTLRLSVTDTLTDANIGLALICSVALVPWLTLVAIKMSSARRTPLGSLVITLISVLLVLIVLNALFIQSRSQLLYPVFAAFIVWCAVRIDQDRLKLRTLLPVGLAVFGFAAGYFALVAITRRGLSEGALSPVAEQLVGYFVGSYNRFAAILDNVLVLPSKGGYYWTQWIWEMPLVSGLLNLEAVAVSLFGAVGVSQFEEVAPYVSGAGLYPSLTSLTIFSHTFIDFGWLGFAPFIIYGFVSRVAWVAFQKGSAWAVIAYPYVLWSIVEWRGYIEITRPSGLNTLIFVAVAVTCGQVVMRAYVASRMRLRRPAKGNWTGTTQGRGNGWRSR